MCCCIASISGSRPPTSSRLVESAFFPGACSSLLRGRAKFPRAFFSKRNVFEVTTCDSPASPASGSSSSSSTRNSWSDNNRHSEMQHGASQQESLVSDTGIAISRQNSEVEVETLKLCARNDMPNARRRTRSQTEMLRSKLCDIFIKTGLQVWTCSSRHTRSSTGDGRMVMIRRAFSSHQAARRLSVFDVRHCHYYLYDEH